MEIFGVKTVDKWFFLFCSYFFVKKPTKEVLRMAYCTILWHRNGTIPSMMFSFWFCLSNWVHWYFLSILFHSFIESHLDELEIEIGCKPNKIICTKYVPVQRLRESSIKSFYPIQARNFELAHSFYGLYVCVWTSV